LKDVSPEEVTLETALELIVAKEKFDAERLLKCLMILIYKF